MEKKKYMTPVSVLVSDCGLDNLMELSGPEFDTVNCASNDEYFDAKENNLGFSDDWFDYDSSSDL